MGPIQSILRGFGRLRAAAGVDPGPAVAWDDRYWASGWWNGVWGAGMRITPDTVRRIACAQACVRIIGNNIAQMPLKIFSETPEGKRLANDLPEYSLLYSRPNQLQTSFSFRQSMQGHFELSGNAYAEKVMDRFGTVKELRIMHPARVIPEILSNGRMRYKYSDPLTSSTRTLVQEEVFHLRNWSDDGYIGLSTVSMGADIFGVAMAAQDYTARFFQNDSKPSLYFQPKDNTQIWKSKEDKEEFREEWRKGQTGENRHKIGVLPPNLELKEFGMKPSDAQLLDARKFSRIEICSLFGVPPHLVGETEKAATYASVEQFNIMFAVQCILPRVIIWEQALQRDILQDDRYTAKFSMAALLRGDSASRTAAYAVAIQNGWLSQNDVRLLEDLDPIEGGNTYWRPMAWAPLTQINNPDPKAGAGSSKSKQLEDLESDDSKRALADRTVQNAYILGTIADKSPAEITAALQQMGLVPLV